MLNDAGERSSTVGLQQLLKICNVEAINVKIDELTHCVVVVVVVMVTC